MLFRSPMVREIAWANALFTAVGSASTAYGILSLLSPDGLPEKDYYQYKVTMTWTQTTKPYSNVYIHTEYYVEMWLLRDDTSYTDPKWYLLSYNQNEVSSSCIIR